MRNKCFLEYHYQTDIYVKESLKKLPKAPYPMLKKKAKVETILQTSVKALSSIVFTTYRWRGYFRKLLFPEEKKRTFLGTHQCFFRDDFYTGRGAFLLFYCYYHYRGPIFFLFIVFGSFSNFFGEGWKSYFWSSFDYVESKLSVGLIFNFDAFLEFFLFLPMYFLWWFRVLFFSWTVWESLK